jgi:hypothetical protein
LSTYRQALFRWQLDDVLCCLERSSQHKPEGVPALEVRSFDPERLAAQRHDKLLPPKLPPRRGRRWDLRRGRPRAARELNVERQSRLSPDRVLAVPVGSHELCKTWSDIRRDDILRSLRESQLPNHEVKGSIRQAPLVGIGKVSNHQTEPALDRACR